MVDEGIVKINPVTQFRRRYIRQFKKKNPTARQIISVQQFENLVNATTETVYKCLILIMGLCGLRREETTSLNVGSFDFENHIISIPSHPKRVEGIVFMPLIVEKVMLIYFNQRTEKLGRKLRPDEPAFIGIQAGTRIKGERIRLKLQCLAEKLGFHNPGGKEYEKFYPHCLRHFFTTLLMESGELSIEYVKELRGDVRSELYGYYQIPIWRLYEKYLRCIPPLNIEL